MKKFNFKKIIATFALIGLLVGTVTGCSSDKKETTEESGSVAAIKKAGVLKVGTNSGYPPYEFYLTKDGKKELVGYDVDIANAIAKDLGVKVEWVDTDFDALVPSLMTKKFDIVLAGMVATDERKQSIDFSEEYFNSPTVAVAKKDVIKDYANAANLEGKKVVVQSGTTQATAAQSVKGATLNQLPTVTDTVASITSGQSDVLYIAEVSAKNIVSKYPELAYEKITGIDAALLKDGAAVGIPKGDAELKEAVDKVVKELKDSGKLDELFNKNVELYAENEK